MAYRPLDLTGKVAVVTGGTSGIGRALTRGLAEAGADVVPTSRRAEQVAAAADEVAALGRRTLRVSSDVTDRRSLEDALAAVVKGLGRVDILSTAPGAPSARPPSRSTSEEWSAHPRHQPHRHAARLPGLRPPHARARLRAHHQHRVPGLVRRPLEVAAYSASKAGAARSPSRWPSNGDREA